MRFIFLLSVQKETKWTWNRRHRADYFVTELDGNTFLFVVEEHHSYAKRIQYMSTLPQSTHSSQFLQLI